MIDPDLLRQKPDLFRLSLKHRFKDETLVDQVLGVDSTWRTATMRSDALRAEKKALTKTRETATEHRARLKEIKRDLDKTEESERKLTAERLELLARVPNLLSDAVPIGEGESANKPVKTVGEHKPIGQSHEQLMIKLDWLDLLLAAKTTGSRFRYLKRDAAVAQMRLMNTAFNFALKHDFIPILPPVLVRPELLEKGGLFPDGETDTFKVGDLYLSGTSEYLLVAQAMDQIYEIKELPVRFVGFSTCFRKEAGSYGKDTQGMFRQHQFDKVEMVSICSPEQSEKEHQFLLDLQEKFVSTFDLPYQVVLIGSGDIEKKATMRYDLETWFPGQERYRETHSVSNCTDFQARSLGIKFRNDASQVQFAHTLNGTLATERLLLAIIENNQTEEGEVNLPKELRV